MILQTVYRAAITLLGMYATIGAIVRQDVIAAGGFLLITLCFLTLEV